MGSLRGTVIKGAVWSLLERVGSLAITFFVTLILARLLGPDDYGLVGLLTIFTTLGNVLIDSGFGHALVRKQDATEEDYSTVFYLNVVLGLAIYVLLYFAAPSIALFYDQPLLTSVARVTFILIPLNALSIVQNAILLRNLDFRKLSIISLLASLISGIVGVFLAISECGVWAIVLQSITYNLVRITMLWVFSAWLPSNCFSMETIYALWGYSVNLLGVHTLSTVFQNIYTVIIGKMFLLSDVGYYNQAQKLETIPSGTINSVVQQVSYPALSTLQHDNDKLRAAYKHIITMTMYLHFPLILGVVVIAEDLISIVLSEKWLPSATYLRLLCIGSSIYPLHMISVTILKAKGLGPLYFRLELLKLALMVLFILFTIQMSIVWLLCGSICATCISVFINMHYCGKTINYRMSNQFYDLAGTAFYTMGMMGVMYSVTLLQCGKVVVVSLQVFAGGTAYLLMNHICRNESQREVYQLVKSIMRR